MARTSGKVGVRVRPTVTVPARRMGIEERYGVGEEITLSVNGALPQGRPPNPTWALKSGGGTLTNTGGGGARYVAPDLGMAQFGANARTFEVELILRDPQGELANVKLTIVAPDSCGLKKLGPRHQAGYANSGFWGQLLIGPNDVSFMRILIKETRGTINATGCHAGERGTIHQDSGQWMGASKMHQDGTLFAAVDRVWSPAQEPPTGWKPAGVQVAGTLVWDIAWMYKLVGDAGNTGLQFGKAWHKATTLETGSCTVEKAGASHTAVLTDPDQNYADVCPLPTL